MQIEAQGYLNLIPANQSVLQDYLGPADQSTEHPESIRLLSEGNESLATSQEAALLQQALMELTKDLYFVWWEEDWAPASRVSEQFPVLLDVSVYRQKETLVDAIPSKDHDRLFYTLRASFEVKPIEDGMEHPAEEIITNAIRDLDSERVFEWFRSFALDVEHPNFAASVIRCLGRLHSPGTIYWRVDLVRSALVVEDAEIRDAAVQAAEHWGGADIRNVLKEHEEPLPWLRDYVRDVIEDFGD